MYYIATPQGFDVMVFEKLSAKSGFKAEGHDLSSTLRKSRYCKRSRAEVSGYPAQLHALSCLVYVRFSMFGVCAREVPYFQHENPRRSQ